jgi:hypothetical protein
MWRLRGGLWTWWVSRRASTLSFSLEFPCASLPWLLAFCFTLCFTVCAPSLFFFEFSYCLDSRQGAQNMRTFPYLSWLGSFTHEFLTRIGSNLYFGESTWFADSWSLELYSFLLFRNSLNKRTGWDFLIEYFRLILSGVWITNAKILPKKAIPDRGYRVSDVRHKQQQKTQMLI